MDKDTNRAGRPAGGDDGTGSALLVINLCASIAPLTPAAIHFAGLEHCRLYQFARVEDGRTRHRLRLGFFSSEAHAASVLGLVRQQYPTAFITPACEADHKFARGYLPGAAARAAMSPADASRAARPPGIAATPPPEKTKTQAQNGRHSSAALPAAAGVDMFAALLAPEPAATPRPVAAPKRPAAAPAQASSRAAQRPSAAAASSPQPLAKSPPLKSPSGMAAAIGGATASSNSGAGVRAQALELTLSEPPQQATQSNPANHSRPFHVGRGVQIADVGIQLQTDATPPKPATASIRRPPDATLAGRKPPGLASKPNPPAARPTVAAALRSPAQPPVTRSPYQSESIPDLDSTQTLRTLTSAELNGAQEKWFAIQLALSEQTVNLDTMPHLDIFEAYRLYSVPVAGSGKILHSLRLGFFKEEVSAEAVSGYVKTFFASPTIVRVSAAEHARFKNPPLKKAAPARPAPKVLALREAHSPRAIPTVTMEVTRPKVDPAQSGSFKTGAARNLKPDGAKKGAAERSPTGATGKQRVLQQAKTLEEQLLEEAREVELADSGVRRVAKSDSLLSRLVGKLTKQEP